MIRNLIALVGLALLATGCATTTSVPPASPAADETASQEVKCERTEQEGCIELDMTNIKHDETNPLMAEIRTTYWEKWDNEDVRRYLALELGPDLFKCFQRGECEPAVGTTHYSVRFWNTRDGFAKNMAAYETMNRAADPRDIGFREVRPWFDGTFEDVGIDLGQPDRMFELSTREAVGVLQFPWSMVGPDTYILVCASNVQQGQESVVFPPVADRHFQGLWLTPEYLESIRKRGWEYVLMPHTVLTRR